MTCFSFSFKNKKAPTVGIEDDISGIVNLRRFSYRELQIATNYFSALNKVGEGGYGSVFKGKLRDGTEVAVKVLAAFSLQGAKEFVTELELITNIDHENLVKLCGCCVEGSHRIIVYGYLENNSLAQTLLGGRSFNIQFDWSARQKICIGVARGLAFLHEEVRPHIIHRDIKASNILLDNDLTPKISDFGLAKLFPDHVTHISTRIAGTVGYLAPEYAIQGKLTRKADIYSFGVLLLEIVSGRRNSDSSLPHSERNLLEKAWNLYKQDELQTLVDTSIQGDIVSNEACQFIKTGLLCTQNNPSLRPSMSSVAKMLTGKTGVDRRALMITPPGFLVDEKKFNSDAESKKTNTASGTSSKKDGSSSLSSTFITDASVATMTFNSVFDRD